MLLGSHHTQSWIAQISNGLSAQTIDTPEEAALIFSGPRFFIALIAGLVLAFGFQLLLTNLSVAAGISILGRSSNGSANGESNESLTGTVKKVGTAVGIWTLVTVSIALFLACLLAVKLSLINDATLGAIVGLVIWATYFSLLVWVSSTTVGSLVGSVVDAATSGFQAIISAATTAIGAKVARDQIVTTAEAAAAAVRRELVTGIDPETIRENLEDYLARLRPSDLDLQGIRQDFEQLLNDPELRAIASPDTLRNIDRQTFVDLVSSRTDLSKREVNRLADQLEKAWQQTIGTMGQRDRLGELVDYLKTANPAQLSEGIGQRLDQLIDELRLRRQNQQQAQSPNLTSQFLNGLMGVIVGRTDLSDLDVEKVIGKLKAAKDTVTEQADKIATQVKGESQPSYSVIRADVENYLLNTPSWQITPATVEQDFRSVLYDPEANPSVVRRELEQLNRLDFVDLLQSRGLFTQAEISKLSFQLEAVRRDVLEGVTAIEEIEKTQELQTQLKQYIRLSPKENLLNQDILVQDLRPIFEDPDVRIDRLRDRFSKYDHTMLVSLLHQRPDLTDEARQQSASLIERVFSIALADAEGVQEAAKTRVITQWQKLEDYLRHTGKAELNPEGMKRDLRTLLEDPQVGIQDIQARLAHFDRDTLVKLLSQRQDISEAEANQIVDQVESAWYRVSHAPQLIAAKVTEQYDKVTATIADYLRHTGREELNPEGIRNDLQLLLNDPKLGTRALRDRLSRMDRETLVKLLSQREDLSEEQVNQIIDQVLETIRSVVRAPRRLATRTQASIRDFSTSLEEYLRNTGKEELNPEGIKRDLQILLNDPRLGVERMSDRLSHIDRSTIVALLSQRDDMTEEEANQVVDRILSVRDQMMQQMQAIQMRVQSIIDSILNRIRTYLNSLERSELNYDGIKRDIRTLFDDPQAGFEALRDRLSQFDRGTLIALLSSREDISQADAERIVDQIERTRNSILQRAERIQQQVQQRIEDLKYQAQKQVDETRKAAATAAWWLFGTALVSAVLSALAGSIAVAG
jgi:nucleoid DNA-binding protein